MARIARAVIPGIPHHVTQRGNRRQQTFYGEDDYLLYVALMKEWCARSGVAVWAWCLMPNHSHLIVVPDSEAGLRQAMGAAHRRYTTAINKREGWKGYLWQGRFASFAMDDAHALAAARYVELNPVRAGLVQHPAEYRWSSARSHLEGSNDPLAGPSPLLARVSDWGAFLGAGLPAPERERMRAHGVSGRPLGSEDFVEALEHRLGRVLHALPRGPKPIAT